MLQPCRTRSSVHVESQGSVGIKLHGRFENVSGFQMCSGQDDVSVSGGVNLASCGR